MSVRMTPEEIDRYLHEKVTVTVITLNPDGTPLPTPLWYVNQGDVIYFRTMRKTQKVKNLLRDPRAVAQVEDGEVYLKLRTVILKGRAEIVEDGDETAWFTQAMEAKYGGRRPRRTVLPEATQRHYDNPNVVIKLVPEKIRSWDNAKIRTAATP